MNGLSARVLDLLYPNRCDCCGAQIVYDADICTACAAALEDLRYSYEEWAKDKTGMLWDGGIVLYAYEDAARIGVLAMKDGYRGFGRYAAKHLAEAVQAMPLQPDCVVWVPMDRRRRKQQGYAHAELLGKAIAKELEIGARGDLLEEYGGKIRQHDLPAEERQTFAERFVRTEQKLSGETVLLVDDILTTGSTLRRCTKLLRESGAARVYIAAVCAGRLADRHPAG